MAQEDIRKAVVNIIEAVNKNPSNGMFEYQVNTKWDGDVKCSANIRDFPAIVIDEPSPFGGSDLGPSPVEIVLAALGTCQEIMYSALASVMDIPLQECTVKLTGDLDLRGLLGMGENDNVPPGFTKITYNTQIKSSASQEDLTALVNAVENQCPVLDMLTRSVSVEGVAIANGQEISTDKKVA